MYAFPYHFIKKASDVVTTTSPTIRVTWVVTPRRFKDVTTNIPGVFDAENGPPLLGTSVTLPIIWRKIAKYLNIQSYISLSFHIFSPVIDFLLISSPFLSSCPFSLCFCFHLHVDVANILPTFNTCLSSFSLFSVRPILFFPLIFCFCHCLFPLVFFSSIFHTVGGGRFCCIWHF